jgi:hypothetical protein
MKRCPACDELIKYGVAIETTNISYPVLTKSKLYANDDRLIGVCSNKSCSRYGLLQVNLK